MHDHNNYRRYVHVIMVVVIEVGLQLCTLLRALFGCLLSSPLNKLLLEVILPDYMQMYVVCCDVLFWPSYSDTLCEN